MAIQCFSVVRALGNSAHHHVKHFAHRFAGRHLHHAHHVFSHSIPAPHAVPAMVCVLVGLASVGLGGVVAGVGTSRASDPGSVGTSTDTAVSLDPSGFGSVPIRFAPNGGGSPSNAPVPFMPSQIGSLTNSSLFTPSDPDLGEMGSLTDPPVPFGPRDFDPGEIGNLPEPPISLFPGDIGRWPEMPTVSDPSGVDPLPDIPNQPPAVPEPASLSLLGASLLGLALLRAAQMGQRGRSGKDPHRFHRRANRVATTLLVGDAASQVAEAQHEEPSAVPDTMALTAATNCSAFVT